MSNVPNPTASAGRTGGGATATLGGVAGIRYVPVGGAGTGCASSGGSLFSPTGSRSIVARSLKLALGLRDVRSYSEKATAERVALGVYGVKAVANDVTVRLGDGQKRTDTDIAQAAVSALRWNTMVPDEKITVSVSEGWVTLKGRVSWEYQRAAAANAVRALSGVRGVSNTITLEPHVTPLDVKSKIEAALTRSAEIDARRINVAVTDSKVTLSGNVHSWFKRGARRGGHQESKKSRTTSPSFRDRSRS